MKNVEKIDQPRPRKIQSARKRVQLAEHLVVEEPIQLYVSADKYSLYMCATFCCSDAKNSDMADD